MLAASVEASRRTFVFSDCGRRAVCVRKVLWVRAGVLTVLWRGGGEQREQLLSSLKRCKLPFQCAHGRPSLVPLLDLAGWRQRRGQPQATLDGEEDQKRRKKGKAGSTSSLGVLFDLGRKPEARRGEGAGPQAGAAQPQQKVPVSEDGLPQPDWRRLRAAMAQSKAKPDPAAPLAARNAAAAGEAELTGAGDSGDSGGWGVERRADPEALKSHPSHSKVARSEDSLGGQQCCSGTSFAAGATVRLSHAANRSQSRRVQLKVQAEDAIVRRGPCATFSTSVRDGRRSILDYLGNTKQCVTCANPFSGCGLGRGQCPAGFRPTHFLCALQYWP
eukprot:1266324-Rhodomonas_salina.1